MLQLLLDRALERTRAVDRLEADVAEQVERLVRHLDADAALGQAPLQARHLDAREPLGVLLFQRVEPGVALEWVDALRTEVMIHHTHPTALVSLFPSGVGSHSGPLDPSQTSGGD